MSLAAFTCLKMMSKRIGKLPSQIIGAVLSEIVMVMGYFVFEGFIYGFAPSLINIPANATQGVAGAVIGVILIKVFEKARLADVFK